MSLPQAIRGFLALTPMTGYELKAAFDRSVAHFWPADQAQIYRELRKLVRSGDVRQEVIPQDGRPTKKVHHLTETGRATLQAWLATPAVDPPVREPLLVQIFFAEHGDLGALTAQLQARILGLQAQQATFTNMLHLGNTRWENTGRARQGWFQLRTLDWGLKACEAEIAWLTETLSGLGEF